MRQIRVKDRTGVVMNRTLQDLREDDVIIGDRSVVPDGGHIRVPLHLADSAAGSVPSAATLGSVERILGDAYAAGDYCGLSDTAAQHLAVRKRLGAVADGRPQAFLDSAWKTLAGTGSSPEAASVPLPVLTDAQRAVSAAAVTRALADVAARGHGSAGLTDTDVKRSLGHRAAMKHTLSDRWKGADRQTAEKLLDGASYAERMAIKSGGTPHSYCKAADQKLDAGTFYQRQRDYQALREKGVA